MLQLPNKEIIILSVIVKFLNTKVSFISLYCFSVEFLLLVLNLNVLHVMVSICPSDKYFLDHCYGRDV